MSSPSGTFFCSLLTALLSLWWWPAIRSNSTSNTLITIWTILWFLFFVLYCFCLIALHPFGLAVDDISAVTSLASTRQPTAPSSFFLNYQLQITNEHKITLPKAFSSSFCIPTSPSALIDFNEFAFNQECWCKCVYWHVSVLCLVGVFASDHTKNLSNGFGLCCCYCLLFVDHKSFQLLSSACPPFVPESFSIINCSSLISK